MSTLADRLLPRPEFSERHHVDIDAPPDVVWRAIEAVEWRDLPAARFLMWVRSLIGRLRNRAVPRDVPSPSTMHPLARDPGHEAVHGLVGRWWTFGAEGNRTDVDTAEKFLAFAEPGYAKATFGIWTEQGSGPPGQPGGADGGPRAGSRTRLVTETRVVTTSSAAYRSMRRYWPLIRPFSGLIRRLLLAEIKRRATQPQPSTNAR